MLLKIISLFEPQRYYFLMAMQRDKTFFNIAKVKKLIKSNVFFCQCASLQDRDYNMPTRASDYFSSFKHYF